MTRKICIVTGNRADYGLLVCPMRAIRNEPDLALQLIVTGAHLAPEFGNSVDMIVADGWSVDARVEMLVSSDSGAGVAKSVGLGAIGMADAFTRLKPDIVMVLGDRFEILAAAEAALFMSIPLAHLCGGDVTDGVVDDSIRRAITAMAGLHFPTTEDSAARLRHMGEPEDRIHVVGSTGVDFISQVKLLTRSQVETRLGMRLRARNLLITFHPVTRAPDSGVTELAALLTTLGDLGDDTGLIFTLPNPDAGGRTLRRMIAEFVGGREQACTSTGLGPELYLSALSLVDAVIGNSSSGMSEAPSFATPTVNIGSRQDGRIRAASVFDCAGTTTEIQIALGRALAFKEDNVVNPYGDGHASERIVTILKGIRDPAELVRKKFHA